MKKSILVVFALSFSFVFAREQFTPSEYEEYIFVEKMENEEYEGYGFKPKKALSSKDYQRVKDAYVEESENLYQEVVDARNNPDKIENYYKLSQLLLLKYFKSDSAIKVALQRGVEEMQMANYDQALGFLYFIVNQHWQKEASTKAALLIAEIHFELKYFDAGVSLLNAIIFNRAEAKNALQESASTFLEAYYKNQINYYESTEDKNKGRLQRIKRKYEKHMSKMSEK